MKGHMVGLIEEQFRLSIVTFLSPTFRNHQHFTVVPVCDGEYYAKARTGHAS
ncbi:hypothetical protein HMPREF0299_6631 [Corynebacterium matruchotii ATCC 14266]|uniref:Uncharacterized protein n=1 Tax=Corynebacterium matruchotii ATCC 14266 TaxID=553207 RepID=E0DFI7_9CORY|nr:hypothetical protein HMPREF0299_6631 [Corynebacterium matruchotii ATCC 14266]